MNAPYFADLACGPDGAAEWLTTSDGTRIRMAHWPKGDRGTVLIFPGRTEYIEKYGKVAVDLGKRGFASIAVDWRGQGLADRIETDRRVGQVRDFVDYQKDVTAVLAALETRHAPKPWFVLGHSMGGCIGLRALHKGLPVQAAAFSAPMWGIRFSPGVAHIARALSSAAQIGRQGHRFAPGTGPETYVLTTPFKGNVLTSDADHFAWMQSQARAQPDLCLGGPALHWLNRALTECRTLASMPAPDMPTLCLLGDAEKVVNTEAVKLQMAHWPKGRLEILPGAEHETLMERPEIRTRALDLIEEHFKAHS